MNTEKKQSLLFKNLDLAFVYIFIFLVGMAIVFIMTSYINKKANEFSTSSTDITQTK